MSSDTPRSFSAMISDALGLYAVVEFFMYALTTEGSTLASTIFKMSRTPGEKLTGAEFGGGGVAECGVRRGEAVEQG